MADQNTNEPDGYYGEEEMTDSELNLDFLNDDEKK